MGEPGTNIIIDKNSREVNYNSKESTIFSPVGGPFILDTIHGSVNFVTNGYFNSLKFKHCIELLNFRMFYGKCFLSFQVA